MQGVNRVDSWSQFVNLVQDARVRNQALATGPAKVARRTITQAIPAPYQAPQAAPMAAARNVSDIPAVKIKTLGSHFDAYA